MSAITLCTLTGSVESLLGSGVQNCTLTASILTPFIHPTNGAFISGQIASVETDASGGFSISVIETETAGIRVRFTFDYFDGVANRKQKSYSVVVPNLSAAALSDLIVSNTSPVVTATFPALSVTVSPINNLLASNAQSAFAELQADITALQQGSLSTTLASSKFIVGNASNVATAVNASGDLTLAASGAFTIAAIQTKTVSGTTGTANVVFSANPTLTGTISADAASFGGQLSAPNGPVRIGTTGTLINTREQVSIYSPYTTDTENTTGVDTQLRLTTNSSMGNTYRALRSETVRTVTANTADNGGLYGGTFGLSIENGTNTWSNVNPIATLQCHELKGYGAGSLTTPFTAIFVTPEPAVIVGRKGAIYLGAPTNGTSNAHIHDNWAWSGNWFINSSSALPSTIGGALGIGVSTTPAAKLDVSTTGTIAQFATSGANDAAIIIDNAAGGNESRIAFNDAGTAKYRLKKKTDNSFSIEDTAHSSRDAFKIQTDGTVTLLPGGTGNVAIGKAAAGTALDVSGTVTATAFVGPLTGNVTGNASGTSATFTGSLTGDVTSTGMATTVAKIQTTTVSGTTGSTNVVFSASPTLTGTANVGNISSTTAVNAGIFTITNALAATSITGATVGGITGGGTANFALGSSSTDGLLLVCNETTGNTCVYLLSGGSATLFEMADPATKFTATPTTPSMDNLSISTTNLVIEHNSSTVTHTFRVTFIKI